MGRLEKLKAATTLSDVAKLLHYTPKGLSYVLYKLAAASKYKSFQIPKKSGGVRHIEAPTDQLKFLQSRLAELLSDCLDEIEKEQPHRQNVSHGFHRKRSILTNAIPHRRRRYVLNIDLTNFLDRSISAGSVGSSSRIKRSNSIQQSRR